MEIILNNAKFADWMRNFYLDVPKPTARKLFQWMEDEVIPFWMFPDIADRVLNPDDEQYFDVYDVSHHSQNESQVTYKNQLFTVIENCFNNQYRFTCICFIILEGPFIFIFLIFLFKTTFGLI